MSDTTQTIIPEVPKVDEYRSKDIKEIVTALSKFQGQAPTIEKNRTVNYGKTKYNYADIADVMIAIRKPLSDNGLFVSHSIQMTGRDVRNIVTTVFHESGQWLKSSMTLDYTTDEKTLGGKITYYRRYALGSLLGLVTDDDVDCDMQGAGQIPTQKPTEKPQADSMTTEMKDFCKENEKTPYFREFITFIAEKTNNSELEMIRQGAEKQDRFLEAVKSYGAGEEIKKASHSVGNKKPQEQKEKAQIPMKN